MYMHVVLMEIEADAAFHAEVEHWCDRVRGECDGVLGYVYRDNTASRADGLGHTVIAHFVDEAAHDAYQASPAHQGMKAFMAPAIRRIVVFDGDVPALAPAPAA
jgi:quinol monooxygenase YgiN